MAITTGKAHTEEQTASAAPSRATTTRPLYMVIGAALLALALVGASALLTTVDDTPAPVDPDVTGDMLAFDRAVQRHLQSEVTESTQAPAPGDMLAFDRAVQRHLQTEVTESTQAPVSGDMLAFDRAVQRHLQSDVAASD